MWVTPPDEPPAIEVLTQQKGGVEALWGNNSGSHEGLLLTKVGQLESCKHSP